MNRRLQQVIAPWLRKCAYAVASLAALVLLIGSSGCASGRPAPLRIDHPSSATVANDFDQGLNLRLVTYNIWGLPSWMTGARSGRYPRIAKELERLAPDVILLQEAWTAEARKSVPTGGHWSIARPAGQHTFFQQSGLVTISRFPIIGGGFYPFSRAAFPDRLVNKGVLKVSLQLASGQVLNVWNVHLQDGGSATVRLSQIRELIARVRAAEDGQLADLVAGDFNCTPGSSLYSELSNALGPSVQEISGNPAFVTWDGLSAKPGAGETLDHIFVRKRSPFETVQASPRMAFSAARRQDRLSDHIGIEADLNLSSGASLARVIGPALNDPNGPSPVMLHRTYAGGD